MKSLSWKTTLCGVLGIVGLGITQVFDGYPLVFKIGAFLAGIAGPLGLLFARDNDKSSEQVGAVPVPVIGDPPPAPRSVRLPVNLLLGGILLALTCTGCTRLKVAQTDDPTNGRTTTVTGTAWFSSAQLLTKFKTLQTDKTQSTGMESLNQQGSTNTVEALQALVRFLELIRPAP